MNFTDHHLTDEELSEIMQKSYDEMYALDVDAMNQMRLRADTKINVKTYFLNPKSDVGVQENEYLLELTTKFLETNLPPDLLKQLPNDVAETFVGLGDFAYVNENVVHVIFSRPNELSTLRERIVMRTGISDNNIDVPSDCSVFGYDNLELMNRGLQVLNSLSYGGRGHLMQGGKYEAVQFQSMMDAKRAFVENDGDPETLAIHESVAHVSAFTKPRISPEYTGFMAVVGFPYAGIQVIYGEITKSLVHAENLVQGVHDLLDRYDNEITQSNGKNLSAFHAYASVGDIDEAEKKLLLSLSPKDLMNTVEHFIAYKTAKGLDRLLGPNVEKYRPSRKPGVYQKINQFLAHRYS